MVIRVIDFIRLIFQCRPARDSDEIGMFFQHIFPHKQGGINPEQAWITGIQYLVSTTSIGLNSITRGLLHQTICRWTPGYIPIILPCVCPGNPGQYPVDPGAGSSLRLVGYKGNVATHYRFLVNSRLFVVSYLVCFISLQLLSFQTIKIHGMRWPRACLTNA